MFEETKKQLSDESFINRIHKISAIEKYSKTEFLHSLIKYYSENKNLIANEYKISQEYRNMSKINLDLAENDFESLAMYENYIAKLDKTTAKTINDEYKNERS